VELGLKGGEKAATLSEIFFKKENDAINTSSFKNKTKAVEIREQGSDSENETEIKT